MILSCLAKAAGRPSPVGPRAFPVVGRVRRGHGWTEERAHRWWDRHHPAAAGLRSAEVRQQVLTKTMDLEWEPVGRRHRGWVRPPPDALPHSCVSNHGNQGGPGRLGLGSSRDLWTARFASLPTFARARAALRCSLALNVFLLLASLLLHKAGPRGAHPLGRRRGSEIVCRSGAGAPAPGTGAGLWPAGRPAPPSRVAEFGNGVLHSLPDWVLRLTRAGVPVGCCSSSGWASSI